MKEPYWESGEELCFVGSKESSDLLCYRCCCCILYFASGCFVQSLDKNEVRQNLTYVYSYRIAGIFRGGLIYAVFAVNERPRKINPRINVWPTCDYKGQPLQLILCKRVNFSRNWARCAKIRPANNYCNTTVTAYAKIYLREKYPLYGI